MRRLEKLLTECEFINNPVALFSIIILTVLKTLSFTLYVQNLISTNLVCSSIQLLSFKYLRTYIELYLLRPSKATNPEPEYQLMLPN